MSNLTDLISAGGGGSASFPTIFLSKSQTWVPPQDGNIMIHLIGAGGGGACSSNWQTNRSGGGAGGYSRKNTLAVTTGGSFTLSLGAFGERGNYAIAENGSAGGNSTFSGTNLSTMTANGGAGGTSGNSSGGTASGGSVNYTGGGSTASSGGGAIGLTGTGQTKPGEWWGGHGARCDIIGDFWSSSLGQIAGEPPNGDYANANRGFNGFQPVAGALSGGAMSRFGSNSYSGNMGQDASIGGGGGPAQGTGGGTYFGGKGGAAICVIQYIP